MNCDKKGKSLQLYFIDGRPDGMLTAEVFNWTGHVLMAPRTQIRTALDREEAGRTGVYLLLGESLPAGQEGQGGEALAYIGKAENISNRIRYHLTQEKMNWWETAVLVTSANNNLNAAHVTYLEARLIEKARAVGFPLYNANNPARPGLSEADQVNMEVFLDYLLMILPALRIDVFPDRWGLEDCCSARPAQENGPVVFELDAPNLNLRATAFLEKNGDFVVQQGSQARLQWAGGDYTPRYAKEHARLVSLGVLHPDPEGNNLVFTKNWPFTRTSAAASVVLGMPANGRIRWRRQGNGQAYGDWEGNQLGRPPEGE